MRDGCYVTVLGNGYLCHSVYGINMRYFSVVECGNGLLLDFFFWKVAKIGV